MLEEESLKKEEGSTSVSVSLFRLSDSGAATTAVMAGEGSSEYQELDDRPAARQLGAGLAKAHEARLASD
jgi:hypothetical protein